MKKNLLSLVSCLMTFICISAGVPASVSRAVKQVNAAPTLQAQCTVNGRAASMTLSGECFHLDFGSAEVYFDGKTQWSYVPADKELTILNPTAEELAESNPLALLRNLERDFNGEAVRGKANTVRLTPKNPRNAITEATITFNPTTGWPTAITLIMGGQRAELANLRFTVEQTPRPASAFQFTPPKGVAITDLR